VLADYIVSGAGTTAYNGNYLEKGTHGKEPYYTLDGGSSYFLFFDEVDDRWELATSLGGKADYYNNDKSRPSEGEWAAGEGDKPAPTVTAGP